MKKINSLPLKGLALPFVFLFAFSCNSSSPDRSAADQTLAKADVSAKADASANADVSANAASKADADTTYAIPTIPGVPTPQGLLLVKEACLHVSVTNLRSTGQHLEQWLKNTGGYYADWTQAQDGDSLRLELTAKIPVENFEAFKDSAETLGVLAFETASADDKTDEYAEALGKNALAQTLAGAYERVGEKASRTKDALAVLDKSGGSKEGAEAASQDMGKLRRHSAMSTVRLTATQPRPLPPVVETPFGQRLWGNLGVGWTLIEKIILLLATIWPLALLMGGGILLAHIGKKIRLSRFKAAPKP
jgi:hypothetical protein